MQTPRLPRRTELTIKEFLIEELRKEGVNTEVEMSFPTLKGRKQPDAVLKDGGEYYLETELGQQTKLIDGLLQSQDYVKTLGGVGAFAVLFPEHLRKPMPRELLEKLVRTQKHVAVATFSEKDPRTPQRFEGNLEEVAKWIARDVLKPLEIPEPDTGLTIAAIRDAVEYLSASLIKIDIEEIQQVFGGITVFENILQFEKGSYPVQELRKAATYLLVNQIMFYHVLSQIEKDRYPILDENKLSHPSDLLFYFRKVLEYDYTPTFGFNVADKIPESAMDVVKKAVAAIKLLKPEKIRYDLLGKVFHELIPLEDRKYVAAFYTNNEAAELLADLAVEKADSKVIDLACGSGTLLVAAYHQKRRLLELCEGTFTAKDHRRFLEKEITGIDIMPFAAHLAVVHLSLQAPLYQSERARIAVWDSTQLRPSKTIPAIARELMESYKQTKLHQFSTSTKLVLDESTYVKKGVVTSDKIGGESIQLEHVDCVIMNPPFTRQERLPKGYKNRLENILQGYSKYFHGQLGLHGYFIFLADQFLKEGGRLALVLPATVLRVQSTEGLRRFLSDNYTIEFVITAWKKLAFSEAAWFREILLIARKSRKIDSRDPCIMISLHKLPKDNLEAIGLAELVKRAREGKLGEDSQEWFDVTELTQADLKSDVTNWFRPIAVFDYRIEKIWRKIEANRLLSKFSKFKKERDAEVIRGVETKSSSSMTIQAATIVSSEERIRRSGYNWVVSKRGNRQIETINKLDQRRMSIPLSSTLRAFTTPSGYQKFDVGKEYDYIVIDKFRGYEEFFEDFRKRDLPRLMRDWKEFANDRLGNILISRRIVLPVPGFVHLCYFSDEPLAGPGMMWMVKNVDPEDAKILTLWMNSTLHLSQVLINKIEDVWINIHEYVLDEYLVLDPGKISKSQKEKLLKIFEDLRDVEFPSLKEQITNQHKGRVKLDMAVLQALGYSEDEAMKLLNELYSAFKREFGMLEDFMKS